MHESSLFCAYILAIHFAHSRQWLSRSRAWIEEPRQEAQILILASYADPHEIKAFIHDLKLTPTALILHPTRGTVLVLGNRRDLRTEIPVPLRRGA